MIAISLPSLVQAAQEVPISADCVYQGIDCSQEIFRVLAGGWLDRAFAIGETIFLALVALEIVVSGYALWFGKMRDSDVLSTFFFKMGLLAVMMVAIQTYGMWMPNIVYLGSDMAAQVTGEEELNNIRPQHLMNEGFRAFLAIYASLWDAARADNVDGGGDGDGGFRRLWSWTIGIGNTTADLAQMLWMGLLVLIPAMIILFCFIYIAMQWLMVTVESYLVIAAGAIFFGLHGIPGDGGNGRGVSQIHSQCNCETVLSRYHCRRSHGRGPRVRGRLFGLHLYRAAKRRGSRGRGY